MSDSNLTQSEIHRLAAASSEAAGDPQVVPSRCSLNGFAQEASKQPGVALGSLEPLSRLEVRTRNTLYQLTVLDPWESKVLVQGGSFFLQPTEGILCGSSFGGSLLKLRWIGCGMRMEITGAGLKVVTSPVQSVEVQDESELPGPF